MHEIELAVLGFAAPFTIIIINANYTETLFLVTYMQLKNSWFANKTFNLQG